MFVRLLNYEICTVRLVMVLFYNSSVQVQPFSFSWCRISVAVFWRLGIRYLTKGQAMLIFSHCHWGTADIVFYAATTAAFYILPDLAFVLILPFDPSWESVVKQIIETHFHFLWHRTDFPAETALNNRGGIYDQQDATNSQNLFLEMLYMFRAIIAHHQELGNVQPYGV
jgi:hypothetical protein